MKNILFLLFFASVFNISHAQNWKHVKDDFSINFYDVCKLAETHFDTIDITKKGSG